jgi:tetratricopeptide (TPR) repeat protein
MRSLAILLVTLPLSVGCAGNASSTHQPGAAKASSSSARPAMSIRPEKPQAGAAGADKLSNLSFPVSTKSAEAQRQFDNGLTLVFAFNHDEAVRTFEKALKADPECAMAHWGIALALGPNYNLDVDPPREKRANDELQKAAAKAKNATQAERDYIATLQKRFSGAENPDLKKLAQDYAVAAGELAKKYPDDVHAATLSADARMCLRPWALYTKDHEPIGDTLQIVETLDSVLKRDPDHIGANHLYIHAVEASRTPQRALEAAGRLPGLAPECGHLVHMPSHIYALVGDHESAATSNESAIDVDREYFSKHPEGKGGFYEMMYYPHNIHFAAYAHAYQGNYADMQRWSKALWEHVQPHVVHMPMMEGFTVVPIELEVKFRRWDDILKWQAPDEKTMPLTSAMYHFARGMAFADRRDFAQAKSERDKMLVIKSAVPPDTMLGMLNKAHHVLGIAEKTLDAKIAAEQEQWEAAEKNLRDAVALEHDLVYMEPPDWLMPPRETLGGVLLRKGDAKGAEKVFREHLDVQPRNGRGLFGLWKSLEAQPGREHDAAAVKAQFDTAWKNADVKLTVDEL